MTRITNDLVFLTLENDVVCGGCDIGSHAARALGAPRDEEGLAGGTGTADMRTGCAVCSTFVGDAPRVIEAVNPGGIPLAEGDRVVVFVDSKKTVVAALLFFVLPLLAFVIGYGAAAFFWATAGEETRLFGGAVFFLLSLIIVIIRRIVRKRKDWPVVVEKL